MCHTMVQPHLVKVPLEANHAADILLAHHRELVASLN